ncbi:RHS repeat-associated core domain-containing protein, partial [Ralstonia solanacearum]
RDANGQLLRAYYPEGESGPEIGKRVAKADAGTETDADGDEHYGRDQDGDDGKSAPQTESTGSLIYARNHLGSVTDTLTPDGRAVTHTEYGPYGELVKSQGRAEYRSDFGYAGMQYHAASGMYLTLFRAYDPGTGRWVSRDPIGEEGGINLYSYVGGQPTRYTDPQGLCIGPLAVPCIIIAENGPAIAGGLGVVAEIITGTPNPVSTPVSAAAQVATKAQVIHDALDPIARSMRTTTVLRTATCDIAASGARRDLTPAQRAIAVSLEATPAKLPGEHAEVTAITYARENGLIPKIMEVTRDICPACAALIESTGGTVTGPRSAKW